MYTVTSDLRRFLILDVSLDVGMFCVRCHRNMKSGSVCVVSELECLPSVSSFLLSATSYFKTLLYLSCIKYV